MTVRDAEAILPQGEILRTYLVQPFIGKGDLKNILRSRGVFLSDNEKENTIPALYLSLVRPEEFFKLQQAYTAKEDNPKIISQRIKWQGDKTLIESIPDELDINQVLDLDFSNFKVVGVPAFYPVYGDPNVIRLDFTIERMDFSKSFSDARRSFRGSIEVQRAKAGDELLIISTHTAPETKITNKAVAKHLIGYFKSNNHVSPEERIRPITFGLFDNEARFDYFLNLTSNSRLATLSFKEVVDIGVSPDEERALPSDLAWMKERIRNLDLKGISLEESEFLTNVSYRPCLFLHRLDAKFVFSTSGLDGECIISLAFPDINRGKNKDSELEVKIKSISFDNIQRGMDRNDAKEKILRELEFEKFEVLKSISV
ncbi:hypothetical protein QVM54_27525 [Pseudomonas aeruginosa]|uniref:GapS4b family protein n=1 Tax=Pseudomonas aeruginosa TaxID=287 RepID=UPI0009A18877|nr:hypothetical protein [Pseudomonas aeruginosa]EKU2242362.1 hypothetical protein [Pseudomonas aeruginosa]ELS4619329.1 hypothetical protein [Pseudomonas aeruginosa]MCT5025506.1 hypothetical protein [Pseudomonas aeruginosa]MCV0275745.1 hypothetical protein [Pseudomonas aeruginosa]MCV3776306.1 hypothetical protein [Pseudomonas aeruginosa]